MPTFSRSLALGLITSCVAILTVLAPATFSSSEDESVAKGKSDFAKNPKTRKPAWLREDANSPTTFLNIEAIQKELQLTTDQKKTLAAFQMRELPRTMPVMGRLHNNNLSEFEKLALQQQLDQLRQNNNLKILKILTAKQRERLRQLILQHKGPFIVLRPDLQRALNLSPDQIILISLELESYQALFEEQTRPPASSSNTANQTESAKSSDHPDFEKISIQRAKILRTRRALSTAKQQAESRVMKLLRKRQREKLSALLGPPFNFGDVAPPYLQAHAARKQKGANVKDQKGRR